MNAKQREFYLQHKGNKCPFCERDNIQGVKDSWESDDDWASHEVECLDCKKIWKDIYILEDVVD